MKFLTCTLLNDELIWLLCGGLGGGSIGLCCDCCDSDSKNFSRFICNWKWIDGVKWREWKIKRKPIKTK